MSRLPGGSCTYPCHLVILFCVHAQRAAAAEQFFDKLAEKYGAAGGGKKGGKRKVSWPRWGTVSRCCKGVWGAPVQATQSSQATVRPACGLFLHSSLLLVLALACAHFVRFACFL